MSRQAIKFLGSASSGATAPAALLQQTPLPQPSLPWRGQEGLLLVVVLAPMLKVVLVELIPRAPVLGPPKGINQSLLYLGIQSLL
jgi:hypothetical protein